MADRRVFFALWPTDRQREELRNAISAAIGAIEGKVLYRGSWHVTLVFVGDFPDERLPELAAAVADIRVEPFRLRFDRLDFWRRPPIACLTAAAVAPALATLVAQLEAAVAPLGIDLDERTFRPHITVVRQAQPFSPEPLARPLTLEWSDFALLESVSTGHGMDYRPLNQRLPGDS